MSNKGRPWTEEEIKTLYELRAANLRWVVIAEKLGRTSKAVQWYWRLFRMSPEKREVHRAGKRASKERIRQGRPKLIPNRVEDPRAIPVETIAEWKSRLAAQSTLTGSFFGDPPIGYSALDLRGRQ